MEVLSENFLKIGQFQGVALLVLAMIITLFTSFSERKSVKIFAISINALSYAGALYLYINNYLKTGPFEDFLVIVGFKESILLGIIIFCTLNILFYVSFYRFYEGDFTRIIIMLTFTLISASFLIISSNFIIFFISLVITIFNIFALISSTNPGNNVSGEAIGKFGSRNIAAPVLFFFGFSILYGSGKIKSFFEAQGPEAAGDPFILISTIVFACGLFLYLFLYPFQGSYLKLARRINGETLPVLWFLYIPMGIIMLMKFEVFFDIFLKQASISNIAILAAILSLSLFGANIGAVRTTSLKRIISMLVLFSIGNIIFGRVIGPVGLESRAGLVGTDINGLAIMIIGFMPVCLLIVFSEKSAENDSILNLRGFVYRKTYISICIILILFWWLAANIYISPLASLFSGGSFNYPGTVQTIILSLYLAAWIFTAYNTFKIVLVLFDRKVEKGTLKDVPIPKVFYIYFSIFTLAAISTIVLSWQNLLWLGSS
jgi:NADH:ubiquinone oxidoreductase subunit 2 (subunit N)